MPDNVLKDVEVKFKEHQLVSGTRTFNGERIVGEFCSYHFPTRKMKEAGEYVGVIHVPADRSYDVSPSSISNVVCLDEYVVNEILDIFRIMTNEIRKIGPFDTEHEIKVKSMYENAIIRKMNKTKEWINECKATNEKVY